MDALLVEVFLESYETSPGEIILDVDATDDPVYGHQAGPFFTAITGIIVNFLASKLLWLARRTRTGRRARPRNWHV